MTLSIEIKFDQAQIDKLMQIPLLMRVGPAERVLKAMAKPVLDKAKALAPSARKAAAYVLKDTRTNREKEGARTTAKFVGRSANSVDDSGKHLGSVFRRNNRGGILIIGGKHPKANKQNYDAGKQRKVMYWGRNPGITKRIDPKDRFMQKAFDETRSAQISAGNDQLAKELKELNLG